MPNRLIDASSPYLLQHAHNPVDWYPWGREALDRARREDKPIFLSIGYAACHWCHVMEHQSFENPQIAALMNQHYINIKVDREERPDLDDLYMLATQLMTGQGGWPMSVWLTPDLKPFYAGTYFPPTDGFGRPGFPRLLVALQEAWTTRRPDLLTQADKVVEAIRMHADESSGESGGQFPLDKSTCDQWLRLAVEQLSDRFDPTHGGFGRAPKFPPHQALQLYLAILQTPDNSLTGISTNDRQIIAEQAFRTLEAMKDGGIYDHIGGAFARYSTDEEWLVPHFEKMLYDSAQLAPLYAQASVLFPDADFGRVARETLDFFLREMQSPEGAFFSSLDADSEGAEGKYYVWTRQDVQAALTSDEDAELMCTHLGITAEGNWHESPVAHATVPAIAATVESLAQSHQTTPQVMRARLDTLLQKMRTFRTRRPRPGLDDKILTSWNGLMLSALAIAGRTLNEPRYLDAAQRLAHFLNTRHMLGDQLHRVSRNGTTADSPAFLDDHAALLNGLLDLAESGPSGLPVAPDSLSTAQRIASTILSDFADSAHGGFFFTTPRHEQLFARMKNAADNALPSANGLAIRGLLRLANITDHPSARDAAMHAIQSFRPAIARRPEYFPTILLALLQAAPQLTSSDAPPTAGPPRLSDSQGPLSLSITPPPMPAAGEPFQLTFHLSIAPGYHIQPTHPASGMVASQLAVRASSPALTILPPQWPQTQKHNDVDGYFGDIDISLFVQASGPAEGTATLRASLTAQPCAGDHCLAPQTLTLEIPLTFAAAKR